MEENPNLVIPTEFSFTSYGLVCNAKLPEDNIYLVTWVDSLGNVNATKIPLWRMKRNLKDGTYTITDSGGDYMRKNIVTGNMIYLEIRDLSMTIDEMSQAMRSIKHSMGIDCEPYKLLQEKKDELKHKLYTNLSKHYTEQNSKDNDIDTDTLTKELG